MFGPKGNCYGDQCWSTNGHALDGACCRAIALLMTKTRATSGQCQQDLSPKAKTVRGLNLYIPTADCRNPASPTKNYAIIILKLFVHKVMHHLCHQQYREDTPHKTNTKKAPDSEQLPTQNNSHVTLADCEIFPPIISLGFAALQTCVLRSKPSLAMCIYEGSTRQLLRDTLPLLSLCL